MENLASTGIRFPDRPARSLVAIPTELLGPRIYSRQTLFSYTALSDLVFLMEILCVVCEVEIGV